MSLLASFGDTAKTIGVIIGVVGGLVGFVVLIRAAMNKGSGQADQQAAAAWKSLAEAHAAEIAELRNTMTRQQARIDQQTATINELKDEVRQLRSQPDYSELLTIIKEMVAMQKQSGENEQTILTTVASTVENERAIRDHAHQIKGSLEGIGKVINEVAAAVLTSKETK